MCFRNLIYKLVTLLPWFIFVFSFAVPLEAITLDRVIARINSDVITLGSLNDRMTVILNQMKAAGSNVEEMTEKKVLMKEVLDSMIAEKLQVQEAKKLGMDVTEETIQNVLNDLYKDNNITEEQFQTVLSSEGNSMEAYKDSIRDQILASRISKRKIAGWDILD